MATKPALQRLVFIRHLVRLADEQSLGPYPMSCAAFLTWHDAVELTLQLLCEHKGVHPGDPPFMKYFEILEASFPPDGVPEKARMRRLNDARRGLKHGGIPPAEHVLDECRDIVSAFFEATVPLAFGMSLDAISLAHLVGVPAAREALLQAQADRQEGRLSDALTQLSLAFAHVLAAHEIPLEDYGIHGDWMRSSEDEDVRRISDDLMSMQKALSRVEQELAMLRYGIDTRHLGVFHSLTPTTRFAAAGNPFFMGMGSPNPTVEEVVFCEDFVVDAALRIEQSEASTGRVDHLRRRRGRR